MDENQWREATTEKINRRLTKSHYPFIRRLFPGSLTSTPVACCVQGSTLRSSSWNPSSDHYKYEDSPDRPRDTHAHPRSKAAEADCVCKKLGPKGSCSFAMQMQGPHEKRTLEVWRTAETAKKCKKSTDKRSLYGICQKLQGTRCRAAVCSVRTPV